MRVVWVGLALALLVGGSWNVASAADVPCTVVVDDAGTSGAAFATIQPAVDKAKPGDLVCVRSVDHQGERVHVTRSGTAEAPIRLLALAAVRTAGFVVEADHVTIEGFTVANRRHADHGGRQMGIYLAGVGNAVLRNVVTDSDSDGIGCEIYAPNCPDAVIAGNVVVGADGSGIVAAGSHVLVEGNDVSGSRKVNAGDADGMRFFGAGIVIRGNYVHDISDRGYPAGEEPHTDCFQTFEGDPPAAKDVLIENNVCENVAHQCLIATSKTPGRSARIVFRGNHCGNTGSQALLIGGIAGVRIERNVFLPKLRYYGIVLQDGAADATIADNRFLGSYQPFAVDASSQPGLRIDSNSVLPMAENREAAVASDVAGATAPTPVTR